MLVSISFGLLIIGLDARGTVTLPTPRTLATPSTRDKSVIFGDVENNAWYNNNIGGNAGWVDSNVRRISIPDNLTSNFPNSPVARNPWAAPGSSEIMSPCGIRGGGSPCDSPTNRQLLNDGRRIAGAWACTMVADDGFGFWEDQITGINQTASEEQQLGDVAIEIDGRDIPQSLCDGEAEPCFFSRWRQGGVAMVAWSVQANNLGGYSWRLCPGEEDQTEACFQQHPLRFASDVQVLRFVPCEGCVRSGQEMVIPLVKETNNVHPVDSEWAKVPMGEPGHESNPDYPCPDCDTCAGPDCDTCAGGSNSGGGNYPPGHYHSDRNCYHLSTQNISIVDLVRVPNLPVGKYTLSWRWDGYKNPQVWTNCADITIVDPWDNGPVEWPVPVPFTDARDVTLVCPAENNGIGREIPDTRFPVEILSYYNLPQYYDHAATCAEPEPQVSGTGPPPTGWCDICGTGDGSVSPTGWILTDWLTGWTLCSDAVEWAWNAEWSCSQLKERPHHCCPDLLLETQIKPLTTKLSDQVVKQSQSGDHLRGIRKVQIDA